jgi:hypothetical protein
MRILSSKKKSALRSNPKWVSKPPAWIEMKSFPDGGRGDLREA